MAGILVSVHGLEHMYTAAFSVLLPEIKDGLLLSNAATGALISGRQFGSGVFTMPAGFAADRYSSRWSFILTVALLFIGLGYFLSGTTMNYWVILGAVVLAGIGASTWHPAAIAALSSRFPARRGFAISLHGAGGSVGEVTGPLVAGGLLLALAWTHVLQFSLIPALAAAGLVWITLKGMRGQEGVASAGQYFSRVRQLARNQTLIAILMLSSIRSMSNQIMATFVPIYIREDLGYSPLIVGVYVSLLQAIGVASHPIMGHVSDRYGRKAVLVPGMMVFGLLCIALAFAAPGVQLTLVIIGIGVFIFTFHAIFLAAALDVSPPGVQGTTIALVYTGSNVIGSLGAVTAGVLADAVSVEATFIYAGIVVFAAALVLGAIRIPRPRAPAIASSAGGGSQLQP